MDIVKTKEDIIKAANFLYEQVYSAKCEFDAIQFYKKNINKYEDAFNVSRSFHNIVLNSLTNSILMIIAKLYELNNEKAITIQKIIGNCKEFIHEMSDVLSNNVEHEDVYEDWEDLKKLHISIYNNRDIELSKKEIIIFQKSKGLFKNSSVFNQIKRIDCDTYNLPNCLISATFEEVLTVFDARIDIIENKIKKISDYRNKIFAHNDITNLTNSRLEGLKDLSLSDLGKLIDLGLDITIYIIAEFTKVIKTRSPIGIDDLEITLEYVTEKIKENSELVFEN